MSDRPFSAGRRGVAKALLALPAAAALGAGEPKREGPPDTAEFIAAHEAGLSAEEKTRLVKNVADAEKALAVVRDFKLPADVAPALRFRPLKSKRS